MKTSIGLVSNSEQKSEIWKDPSVGRPAGRPTHVPVDSAGRPLQPKSKAMSVGRPCGRPFFFCGRSGGRPLLPVHVGAHWSTVTTVGQYYLRLCLPYLRLWLPLSLPTWDTGTLILHKEQSIKH